VKYAFNAVCAIGALIVAGGASAQQAAPQTPAATAATNPADAPVGKQAGTVMIRVRAIGVVPEDNSSSTSIGGHVSVTPQPAPEVDFSYFFTDHIAAELIAATTRHELKAVGTAVGDVDVGSTWVLPPTVTLQYHFMPHRRFSPYLGAGVNASLFYATHAAQPVVERLKIVDRFGEALQIGFDYNIQGHWFLNVDAKQIFLKTKADAVTVLGPVSARTALDPLVVGAGVGYRF
jgi:outer membrane protein